MDVKKYLVPCSFGTMLALFPVLAFAETTTVSYTDISSIIDALTAQINVSSVVGVIAAVVAIAVGLVFMWWAARKATGMIMSAFRKGKASV